MGESHNVDESPIVLVHRGDCSFVTKVRNVENAGGHVALIIDNKNEDLNKIVMADDGRGSEVTIPGLLISKMDGLILTDFIENNKNQHIVLDVEFEMEHSSNTVKYDIYTTGADEQVYLMFKEFYPYHFKIEDQLNFTVHYITYQHPQYNSEDPSANKERKDCMGKGKYCADPGNFGTTDGLQILREALRQKCIFLLSDQEGGYKKQYWDYMLYFYDQCLNITKPTFNAECGALVMEMLDFDQAAVNACIGESFIATQEERKQQDFEKFVDNKLLDQDNEDRITYLQNLIPSITINGRNLMGNTWKGSNVFEAICAGFKKKPEACYDDGAFKRESKLTTFWVVTIIIIIIAVNVVIFIICKNYIKRKIVERIESTDINHKINTVVTSYLALRENKANS